MIVEGLKDAVRPYKRSFDEWRTLPLAAKAERRRDRAGGLIADPGPEVAISATLDWIAAAQDGSLDHDGGVARHYSLIQGWGHSYPETTGYVVPTLLGQAERLRDSDAARAADLATRARRMLDWCSMIQYPEGGFQGGVIGQEPRIPVTFNTGQILIGLAAGCARFGDAYRAPMERAAHWLRDTLDADGCWRKHPSPFASFTEKAYETHASWGLLEAARVGPDNGWSQAALRQNNWAVSKQRANGWMHSCCLSRNDEPLTHTLGYCLKGFVEAWRFGRCQRHLDAAVKLAEGLRIQLRADDRLPGRFREDWSPAVQWVCLTGQAQIVWSWFALHEVTGDAKWKQAAIRANRFVRRTLVLSAPRETRGAVKGSWPIDGDYCRFEYPNWAAKFAIDANQYELDLR
jgi:hypothetical protein